MTGNHVLGNMGNMAAIAMTHGQPEHQIVVPMELQIALRMPRGPRFKIEARDVLALILALDGRQL